MRQINLIITVGCSASGKSTFAKNVIQQSPEHFKELNRDILRAKFQKLNGIEPLNENTPDWSKWNFNNEVNISKMFLSEFKTLINNPNTETIVWSDTNINYCRLQSTISSLKTLAENIELNIHYKFFIEFGTNHNKELIERDKNRIGTVGEKVIFKQLNTLFSDLPLFYDHFPYEMKEKYGSLSQIIKNFELTHLTETKNVQYK